LANDDDPKAALKKLEELGADLDAARRSGQQAVAEIAKAKRKTKRIKTAVKQVVNKLRRARTRTAGKKR